MAKKVRVTDIDFQAEEFEPIPSRAPRLAVLPADETVEPGPQTVSAGLELADLPDRPGADWQTLDRKEVFLWPDQRDSLGGLERQLHRAGGRDKGQRVTANTLIRVAVDLLLERRADLVGVSEVELRARAGVSERATARYLTLDRKEVFLWPDQRDALEVMERQLNRARGRGNGERITANTLIRLAVDLLLEHQVAQMPALAAGGAN